MPQLAGWNLRGAPLAAMHRAARESSRADGLSRVCGVPGPPLPLRQALRAALAEQADTARASLGEVSTALKECDTARQSLDERCARVAAE